MTAARNSDPESQDAHAGPTPATSGAAAPGPRIPIGIPNRGHGTAWAWAGVAAGGAVSVAGNVLHSSLRPADLPAGADWHPHAGAVFGAVWWPLSLFLALEVLVTGRWGSTRRWVAARVLMVAPVAAVAAVVSYHHLSGLLGSWGEDGFTVRFGPVAVDGLMMVCSAALYRARVAGSEPAASRQVVAIESASEPPAEAEGDGWAGPPSRPTEPAHLPEPSHRPKPPEPPTEPASEPPAEPAHLGSVSPIRRPTPAARSAGRKPARSGLQECGCGLDYCPGMVPKSTRTAHHRRVREAAELAVRAESNGHRERVSAP